MKLATNNKLNFEEVLPATLKDSLRMLDSSTSSVDYFAIGISYHGTISSPNSR